MIDLSASGDKANVGAGQGPGSRCGIVAVIGRTNAGKSTLVNHLLDEKVSIVTPLPQTTRNVVRGVWTESRGQIVLLDTPGLHHARTELGRQMNRFARASVDGANVALLVVDASAPPELEDEGWMRRLRRAAVPVVVALNKADRGAGFQAAYEALWRGTADGPGAAGGGEPRWARISALDGTGLKELVDLLFSLMPQGPPLFPADLLSDFPRRLLVADVVREKLFGLLRKEVPYAVAVRVPLMEESEKRFRIDAEVLVDKASQLGIVIGRGGRVLDEARRLAASDLRGMLGKRIDLRLRARAEKGWMDNPLVLRQLGYAP